MSIVNDTVKQVYYRAKMRSIDKKIKRLTKAKKVIRDKQSSLQAQYEELNERLK